MVTIEFYPHMIFNVKNEISDMLRGVDIVVKTMEMIVSIFGGKIIYIGDGSESFQFSNAIEFENLSELHKNTILSSFNFCSEYIKH